ncbi:SDR family oxidoreductase, partial [Nocardiopsis terrae]
MDSLTQSYGKTFDHDDALIAQHRFDGRPLLPAAAQIEMMLFAFLEGGAFAPVQLHGIEFPRPLALAEGQRERVRLEARSRNGDQTDLTLRTEDGRVLSASRGQTLNASAPEAGPVSCTGSLDPGSLYSAWSSAGLEYGPDLRVVRSLAVSAGQVEADLDGAASAGPWLMHPHLVDGVLQLVSVALQSPASASQVRVTLPVGISRIAVFAPLPPRVTVRVRRVDVSGTHGVADAQVLDGEGGVIALLEGVRMHLGAVGTRPGLGTQLSWTPEAPSFPHPVEGTWVVLRDTRRPERTAQDETVGLLRERGARVVEVLPPGAAPPEEGQARCLSEVSEAAFAELWDEVGEVSGVVHMWSTGPGRAEEEELDTGLHACAHALRTLGAHQRTSRFTVVTEHAQPVSEGDRPLPARSALWGLVRTAAIEYPGLSPRLVDLDSSTASALAAAEEPVGEKPECAYRDGSRTVPCLVEAPLPARRPGVRPGGRYLLLGGHGGIGVEVAARLAGEGAGELVLVGRSDPDPGVVERLAGTGCRVRSLRADASVPGAMAQVVAEVLSDGRGLHGVVHAAGVLRDGLLRSSTREDVDAVLAPKVSGARELASAVEGLELDFAVLFGSVSGTFGNLGQAGYAAANAYLDGFAHAQGSPWTTVSWGLWGEVGMGVEAADQLRRRGVRPLGNQEALDAFVSVLRSDERMVVVAHPDGRTVPHPVSGRGRPLAVPEPAPAPRPAPAQDAAAQDAASPTAAVGERVERFLARRLGAERLTPATPLSDYGIDSIMSVEMAEELSRIVGRELPSTLFLEHPDVAGVTRALIEEYGVTAADGTAVPAAEADTPPAPAEEPVEEGEADSTHGAADAPVRDGDVAIVAVSGDLPGAEDLDGFWDLLMSGGTAFTEVPEQRWDVDALFEPRSAGMSGTYCRNGAFLRLPDRFDHRFFQTSRREADEMDPQQKLLLEHAWRVVDEAGLSGRPDIGVFVGATYQHHRDASGLEEVSPHTALGSMNALLANRISYTLDLTGPSQTVDTLCSSSLVALHQAVQALRAGQCGAAVVAACHVGLTPWYYRSLSQLGALSPDLPRPFDEDADGFVPGEGAVAVLLRPLADAERDGDHVWGVVRGTAVNHGGRGGALPVPRRSAQEAVIRAALADAGTAPEEVSLIEAHGTATQLGDPVEVAALGSVFGSCAGERLLGSLKANIGHLEPASGLAALVKVLLCLRHGAVPPLAGYRTPSSRIDLEGAGLSVNREARAWSDDRPRVAGVSAFGMGGANAHAVIAEHQRETAPEPEPGAEQVLLLSGHTPEALTRRIRDVADWLSTCEANLAQVCFSAAVGRDHREFRAAFYGTDRAEILAGAHRSLESETGPVGVWAAGVGTPLTGPAAERAARFVGGETVDRGPDRPSGRRVVLPPYPLGGTPAPSSAPGSGSPVTLPKTEEEGALVAQHRVRGEQTVPAALLVLRALAHADAVDEMVFAEPGTGPGELTEERSGGTLRLRWDGRNIARARLGGTATQAERTVPDGEPRRSLDPVGLYAWFEAAGVEYGPALAVVDEVRFDTGVTVCSLRTDPNASPGAAAVAALDAALQSMAVLTIADRADTGPLCLPASVDAIRAFGDPALCRRVRTRLVSAEPGGTRVADTVLLDEGGRVLLSLSGVHYAPVPAPDRRPLPEGEPEPGPPAPSRNRSVTDVVRTLLREPDLTPDTPFTLLAVDSMLATEISERLESELAVTVSALDVLDARDCRALAAAVGAPEPEEWQTRPQEATAEEPPAEPADRPAPSGPVPHPGPGGTPEGSAPGTRDVAVVGVALALPGARTPEELWGLLEEGRSAVGTAPAKRWEGRRTRPPGGFLEDIEDFDAQLFGVFANQARVLDPQARWLLRGAWECLESAGVPPTSAAGTRTGMFVGASYQHYREYNIEPELDALSGLGNHNAFLANRVSHFLDLRGPSMTIDTLCSSSLVALHQAVRSIRDGECEQALVAGVRLALSPLHYHAMNSLKALSPTGRSRAFDATADGFVPGEGVITLLLKPLHHAL